MQKAISSEELERKQGILFDKARQLTQNENLNLNVNPNQKINSNSSKISTDNKDSPSPSSINQKKLDNSNKPIGNTINKEKTDNTNLNRPQNQRKSPHNLLIMNSSIIKPLFNTEMEN